MDSSRASSRTGEPCAACVAWLIIAWPPWSDTTGVARILGAHNQLGELAKMPLQFGLGLWGVRSRGGQHVDLRAVEQFFLQAIDALALRKTLIGQLAVKGHHA